MIKTLADIARQAIRKTGFDVIRAYDPDAHFHSYHYLRHNSRRLEHLASLRIPVAGMSVLEVGAGIGDHSNYYIDRGCAVTITEARAENLERLRVRYPFCKIQFLDMQHPSPIEGAPFDAIHCYGLLYHLNNPGRALEFLAKCSKKLLFLETCVSFGDEDAVNLVTETKLVPTQAYSGTGCRPTRTWLFHELRKTFQHVYVPRTQPCHEEFPLDWNAPERHTASLQRAIFVASHVPLQYDMLTSDLIMNQTRHE